MWTVIVAIKAKSEINTERSPDIEMQQRSQTLLANPDTNHTTMVQSGTPIIYKPTELTTSAIL